MFPDPDPDLGIIPYIKSSSENHSLPTNQDAHAHKEKGLQGRDPSGLWPRSTPDSIFRRMEGPSPNTVTPGDDIIFQAIQEHSPDHPRGPALQGPSFPPALSSKCMEFCDVDAGETVGALLSITLTPALGLGLDQLSLSPLGLRNLSYRMSQPENWLLESLEALEFHKPSLWCLLMLWRASNRLASGGRADLQRERETNSTGYHS